jgi:hypothetical protein
VRINEISHAPRLPGGRCHEPRSVVFPPAPIKESRTRDALVLAFEGDGYLPGKWPADGNGGHIRPARAIFGAAARTPHARIVLLAMELI